jgi:single-strand DNA-binding protein
MATTNINRVVLTGNLTRDPVLRDTSSGTPVCGLRIASNTRRKTSGGEWVDKPNYFSVTVWGALGENCHRFLAKGRAVAIDGRLEWREWTHDDAKREAVEIVADAVQFLANGTSSGNGDAPAAAATAPAEDDIAF